MGDMVARKISIKSDNSRKSDCKSQVGAAFGNRKAEMAKCLSKIIRIGKNRNCQA